MKIITMDPDSVLDYFVEWQRWLDGDTIETSTWLISPDTLTRGLEEKTNTRATIWLSGILEGAVHLVTNRIHTAGGRTEDRSFKLVGRQK